MYGEMKRTTPGKFGQFYVLNSHFWYFMCARNSKYHTRECLFEQHKQWRCNLMPFFFKVHCAYTLKDRHFFCHLRGKWKRNYVMCNLGCQRTDFSSYPECFAILPQSQSQQDFPSLIPTTQNMSSLLGQNSLSPMPKPLHTHFFHL